MHVPWYSVLARRLGDLWFYRPGRGWHPRHYEWQFSHTRAAVSMRAEESAAVIGALEHCWTADSRVLEVGSGTGVYTLALSHAVREVVALDCSPTMRRYLERHLRREGISNVTVRRGCLPDRVRGLGAFDGVVGVGVLNYIVDFQASLVSLAQVLDPAGWCVLTVPADTPEGRRYWRDELLTRRRVYLRSDAEIQSAAATAGLRVDSLTMAGGFTRVFWASPVCDGSDRSKAAVPTSREKA